MQFCSTFGYIWDDLCGGIPVAYCSRVVRSIFALVFQVLSMISQGSVASSPVQKVIGNGSAARKAACFICFPSFVAGHWRARVHAFRMMSFFNPLMDAFGTFLSGMF